MERISALLKAYSSLIEPVRDLQPEQLIKQALR